MVNCFLLFPLPPSTCTEVCETGRLGAEAQHEVEATYLAAAKTKLQKTQLPLKTHQAGATPPLQLPYELVHLTISACLAALQPVPEQVVEWKIMSEPQITLLSPCSSLLPAGNNVHADQAALVTDQSTAYSLQVLGSCFCKNEMPRPRTATMSWVAASVL